MVILELQGQRNANLKINRRFEKMYNLNDREVIILEDIYIYIKSA